MVERRPERAARAWLSGVDGSGSRAVWLLFDGAFGGHALCSLIVNDEAGVMDAAGGEITRKRLETELAGLRASQKLPWVEVEPARALAVVGEALTVHRARGTAPPAAFARWERLFTPSEPAPLPALTADPALVERAPALLELPELAGWFLDPETVQADAVDLLQARESKLVVSDQIKAEREEAIVGQVIERELGPAARRRWARRLVDMAFIFSATDRPEPAAVAEAAAAALADETREARHSRSRARSRGAASTWPPRSPWAGSPPPRSAASPAPRDHRRPRHPGRPRDRPGRPHRRQRRAVRGAGGGRRRAARLGQRRDRPRLPRSAPPRRHRERVVLGGGSRFGGEAIWGVLRWLEQQGRGYAAGPTVVPHVPGAFLFDLNVGDGRVRPTREMGYEAARGRGRRARGRGQRRRRAPGPASARCSGVRARCGAGSARPASGWTTWSSARWWR